MRVLRVLCICLYFAIAANSQSEVTTETRDGQHDWDHFFGTWKMHLRKRLRPLTRSNDWAEFESHDITREVWNGRANLDELEADGPSGHIEGLTLRLYNPHTHQWSIHWANSAAPGLDNPVIGEFRDGRGEFYDQEFYRGRAIFVRYLWTNVSENSGDFEQSFSPDGGRTWEPNWVTSMVRESPSAARIPPNPDTHNGQHDFDFEFGTWNAHIRRLRSPLSGKREWTDYDGSIKVSKIWNGRANLAELDVKSATDQILGLSLRRFDPRSRQWMMWSANAEDGQLDSTPIAGAFRDGRGEFFDQELVEGRYVLVRFIFSKITQTSVQGEQSYSLDGGKTWEPNWIETFTRVERN
jgi:hypothetical protein